MLFLFLGGKIGTAKTEEKINDILQDVASIWTHKTLVGLAWGIVFQPVWMEWLNINKWRKPNLLLTLIHSIFKKIY